MIDGQKRSFLKFQDVRAFLDSVLDEDIHTKRVDSLANATLGVMAGASYQRRVISSNERPVFHRIPSRIMEVISRRWYHWASRSSASPWPRLVASCPSTPSSRST